MNLVKKQRNELSTQVGTDCSLWLNCFEITNAQTFKWMVREYSVAPDHKGEIQHSNRGTVRNALWALWRKNRAVCRGRGFIVDVSKNRVIVADNWQIPAADAVEDEFIVNFVGTKLITVESDPKAFAAIVTEGIKNHFKDNKPESLGPLWQNYRDFCQLPRLDSNTEFAFCRKFRVQVKSLRGNRPVVEIVVGTQTVDNRSFGDYYRSGDVGELWDHIRAKKNSGTKRDNRTFAVRVLHDERNEYSTNVRVLDLVSTDCIEADASLTRIKQAESASKSILCRQFNKSPEPISLDEVFLVLDSQITQQDHAETILEPDHRSRLTGDVADFVDGASIFGNTLKLSEHNLSGELFDHGLILPPAIHVRDKNKGYQTIESPTSASPDDLKKRARERVHRIRNHGHLQSRAINPMLAVPKKLSDQRAKRIKADLEAIWKSQNIDFKFTLFQYGTVKQIESELKTSGCDSLFAVLPESFRNGTSKDNTHEKIKRSISVPSQCICFDNTLPEKWCAKTASELAKEHPALARRINQKYELCLTNLLVKHHWVPFAPADPFTYNVHVGIDVGGKHNSTAMLCLGHGFAKPSNDILFLPNEIPIEVQQKEPIPVDALYSALLVSFEALVDDLKAVGERADLDSVLFFRDGHFFGTANGDNELQALKRLHAHFLKKGTVSQNSTWTAVEILKSAEGWRLELDINKQPCNPIVGQYVFPFEDVNQALVATTGLPYLSRGTSNPLRIQIVPVAGQFSRKQVITDLIWGADMCFTKPDMGMKFPWVLHVADSAALQTARKYKITGIPV